MEEDTVVESSIASESRTKGFRLSGTLFLIISRILLGGLFLYAGFSKAADPDGFIADIARFQLLPEWAISPLAIYLPFLEILTGLALLSGVFYLGALFLANGMLVMFSSGLSLAWWRGLDITCGCFGKGFGDLPLHWALLRNVVLISLGLSLVIISLRDQRRRSVTEANEFPTLTK